MKSAPKVSPNRTVAAPLLQDLLKDLLDQANVLIAHGERKEPEKLLRRLLALQPDHWMAINNLGMLCAMVGDSESATYFFRHVVQLYPISADCWNNLARSLWGQGLFDAASEAFQEALQKNPSHESAALGLAQLNAGKKNPKIVPRYANVRNGGETERVTSVPSEWGQKKINSILPVYYDLSQAPTTFDAAVILAIACGYAQVKNYDAMDVTVLATKYRLSSERDLKMDSSTRDWRTLNIVFRLATLIPRVRNITLHRHGKLVLPKMFYPENPVPGEDRVFIDQYPLLARTFLDGADVQVYRPSKRALQWARCQFTKPDRSIVLSIRNVDLHDRRNANIQDWLLLYQHLMNKGFDVVVIPDQNDALGDGAGIDLGWKLAIPAAVDLDLRLALYNSCRMNFSWSGGQSLLLWLSPAPFRIFGLLNRHSLLTNASALNRVGPAVGSQPPFFQPNQQILWEDASDVTAEFLISEADKALLEADI
ncbi:MAG: tetratricopeptide repeat protein [Betaproteobacteria bacterium]|nr:tetratricopeptide repeat protein [Betaproteobacteria bacterium]